MKIKLKKWKCPICGARGKLWQCSWKANRSGRQHINKKHNGNGNLKLLKRKVLAKIKERSVSNPNATIKK